MLKRDSEAFTLMEIIIVTIIIGAIAVMAIPKYNIAVEKTRAAEAVSVLSSILDAEKSYKFEKGALATDMSDLDLEVYNIAFFDNPDLSTSTDSKVAAISRKGSPSLYTLSININADISCQLSISGYCDKLGY